MIISSYVLEEASFEVEPFEEKNSESKLSPTEEIEEVELTLEVLNKKLAPNLRE